MGGKAAVVNNAALRLGSHAAPAQLPPDLLKRRRTLERGGIPRLLALKRMMLWGGGEVGEGAEISQASPILGSMSSEVVYFQPSAEKRLEVTRKGGLVEKRRRLLASPVAMATARSNHSSLSKTRLASGSMAPVWRGATVGGETPAWPF